MCRWTMLSTSVEQYSCSFTWWPACSSADRERRRRHCWRHRPSVSGVARGGRRARQTKKGINMPPLTSSRQSAKNRAGRCVRTGTQDTQQNGLEHTEDDDCYVHRTQHSQLIRLLEQPVLSLHVTANFDAPAKSMQQTDSAAQHTEWLPTVDSQQRRRCKNK